MTLSLFLPLFNTLGDKRRREEGPQRKIITEILIILINNCKQVLGVVVPVIVHLLWTIEIQFRIYITLEAGLGIFSEATIISLTNDCKFITITMNTKLNLFKMKKLLETEHPWAR